MMHVLYCIKWIKLLFWGGVPFNTRQKKSFDVTNKIGLVIVMEYK